jgi:hypothetical protein
MLLEEKVRHLRFATKIPFLSKIACLNLLFPHQIAAGYAAGNFTSHSIRDYAKKHYQQILDKLESMMKDSSSSYSGSATTYY